MLRLTRTDCLQLGVVTACGVAVSLGLFSYSGLFPDVPPWSQPQLVAAETQQPSIDEFRPQVVIKRRFRPLTKFPIATAKLAAGKINDAELVLGVVIEGQARAYPINMLTGPAREILNDSLGGHAIAATW
jgi:hypothetical protein